ncbi:hypothetical protein [Neptuniibacter halophilus]|uniref:hypothetical protein n=1 Tax=Neptuniibacter halophilus TaxID=651666 RepID=UPI002574792A|nr:hypothetical protein [Neptuniibacter halophilus]
MKGWLMKTILFVGLMLIPGNFDFSLLDMTLIDLNIDQVNISVNIEVVKDSTEEQ